MALRRHKPGFALTGRAALAASAFLHVAIGALVFLLWGQTETHETAEVIYACLTGSPPSGPPLERTFSPHPGSVKGLGPSSVPEPVNGPHSGWSQEGPAETSAVKDDRAPLAPEGIGKLHRVSDDSSKTDISLTGAPPPDVPGADTGSFPGNDAGGYEGLSGATDIRGGTWAPARVVVFEQPSYPPESRILGEEGISVFDIYLGPDARPTCIILVRSSGYPRLDEAARRALMKSSYRPGYVDGKPVACTKRIAVRFVLESGQALHGQSR